MAAAEVARSWARTSRTAPCFMSCLGLVMACLWPAAVVSVSAAYNELWCRLLRRMKRAND